MDCPEIVANSVEGNGIALRQYAGSVIIIQFSRFYKEDLPNLVYLQNLADKYRKLGVFLLFVNTRGKQDASGVGKFVTLSYPVIEDDGTIRDQFNAYPEDTIVVDRNFKIKFKNARFIKPIVYDELIKWLFENRDQPKSSAPEDLSKPIKSVVYYDVLKKKIIRMEQVHKKIVATFSASLCTGCEENSRIQLLKDLSSKIAPEKGEIFLIFGKGNNPDAIRQYAMVQEWEKVPFNIGVIEGSVDIDEGLYYQLFKLDIDPRTLVFDSARKPIFVESRKNTNSLSIDSLLRMIK